MCRWYILFTTVGKTLWLDFSHNVRTYLGVYSFHRYSGNSVQKTIRAVSFRYEPLCSLQFESGFAFAMSMNSKSQRWALCVRYVYAYIHVYIYIGMLDVVAASFGDRIINDVFTRAHIVWRDMTRTPVVKFRAHNARKGICASTYVYSTRIRCTCI